MCQCGCGKEVTNEKNRFINGHNKSQLGYKYSDEVKLKMSKSHIGQIVSLETKEKLSSILKNHKVTNNTKFKISKSLTGRKLSEQHRLKAIKVRCGSKHTSESKLKMSQSGGNRLGKKHTSESIEKMRQSHKNYKFSEEHKHKMSLASIKYIEDHKFNGKKMCPHEGKNERFILDQLQNNIEIEIIRNSRELANITGKFNDGFLIKYNLGIDVLERHHFKPDGKLSDYDQERELIIASKLGCMIYYIVEQEFLSNPEKEIQQFKEFISLLSESIN
jgi:hypothetical protein